MLSPSIYHVLLIAVCAYAYWRGRSDERLAATLCVIATIATRIMVSPVTSRYSSVEAGVFAVDLAVLVGFMFIALRSDRFWPLWVAGLQLTTILAHALKAVDFALMPQIYAAAARFWVYPIFLIIVIGTWRTNHRRQYHEPPLLG
ncbi:hypothetical protein [Sphingomonas sp.]|uniref:hypothetical protein n=1 Tax=Sphingomonas sp. TaxID=28214 RepID=UPI00286C8CAF|nr:hypothetical protein [Sphingomonas sp.]